MKINRLSALILSGVLTAAGSPSFSDPAPKSAGVFAITQALMERCVKSAKVDIALSNAALMKNDDLAHRDVVRIINTCALDLRIPRREGFSTVATEAIATQSCDKGSCSPKDKEDLAKTIFDANKRFTAEYARVLLDHMRLSCSEQSSGSCAASGVKSANEAVELFDYPWMDLSADNRIVALGDPGKVRAKPQDVKPMAKSIGALNDIKERLDQVWPEAPSGKLDLPGKFSTQLAAAGFPMNPETGDFIIEGISKPVQISARNGFWKANLSLSKAECIGFISDMKDLNAIEVSAGLTVIRGGAQSDVCATENTKITVAF